jgi:murein DD-endopeptidase MepM/ murein hydrolase activator NlpD
MKKAFLQAPVRYTRISSKYNRSRFHPVLKRVRPHLGTDYAAPYGTPIYAVANGVVTHRGYTKGNGNYVKIKHDKTYTTQYLHMQRFARDVLKGSQVKQGDVIGYVGSTGLATGPHVCFRFWKNGKQVNHLKENLPEPDPMPESDLPKFYQVRDSLKVILDSIQLQNLVAHQALPESEEATAP